MATEGGTKAVVAALLANMGIAVTKFVAFFLTGISSMLAEAIHSVADSGNQVLLLVGGKRSQREATEQHPFGYGRERYIYSFIVSIVLFSLGGLFALYEAYHKFHEVQSGHHEDAGRWWWVPVVVLSVAIVLEGLSFRTAVRETGKIKGDASYAEFIRRAKQPELPVVLLEDFGALIGLVLAFAGVSIAVVTEDGRWDAYGTIAIGALLGLIAVILVIEMKSLLIGESASRKEVEAIRAAIEIEPDVIQVIHLRTQHLGPDELLVGAKIEFLHELTVAEVAGTIDRVERTIRAGVPAARIIYIEPDVHQEHRVPGFVQEHEGHINPDDPAYMGITGHLPEGDDGEDIWS